MSFKISPKPRILDEEVRRVCRTPEQMLGSVYFPAITFRAGGWRGRIEDVLKKFPVLYTFSILIEKGLLGVLMKEFLFFM